MKTFAHDVEIFHDYFSIVSINVYDTNEIYSQVISDYGDFAKPNQENARALRKYFEEIENASDGQVTYVGYNSIGFDQPVVHSMLDVGSIRLTKEVADAAATNGNKRTDRQKDLIKRHRKSRYSPYQYAHIDLMLIFNKVDRVSLKKMSVCMHSVTVQDLPLEPDAMVLDKGPLVLAYNQKDVMRTVELFHEMYDEILLRYRISEQYGVDVYSSSRSVMGAKIMEKLYLDDHPEINHWQLREMRTEYEELHFRDVVHPSVKFETPQLQALLEDIKSQSFYAAEGHITQKHIKFSRMIRIGKTTYTIGVGGLHSEHQPEYIYSEGQWIKDADVASYYPRIMINGNVYPYHLGEGFLKLFERIVAQRLAAKKQGIKTTADALKITINSVFGKMGGAFEWFYDLLALYRVTVNGQLFLLMLIERLTEAGIDVFYANTDGITAIIKDEIQDRIMTEICAEWEKELGFELEYTTIERMMLRDVNNYTLRTTDGKIKEKGEFIRKPLLGKKVDAQIVAMAINAWFYEGVPIEETIRNQKDIRPFIMTGKVGAQFDAVFHQVVYDETGNPVRKEIKLQRTNRYYAATGEHSGVLFKKRKSDNGLNNMLTKSQVYICNDWEEPLLAPINYDYYINRTRKLIALFDRQATLF